MKAEGFCLRGATAFFDVRVTHVKSKCNQGRPTQTIFKVHENEKKRKYQQRVLHSWRRNWQKKIMNDMQLS